MNKEERRLERLRNKLTPFFTMVDLSEMYFSGKITLEQFTKLGKSNLKACNKDVIRELLRSDATLDEINNCY